MSATHKPISSGSPAQDAAKPIADRAIAAHLDSRVNSPLPPATDDQWHAHAETCLHGTDMATYPAIAAFLASVAEASPYLRHLMESNTRRLAQILTAPAAAHVTDICARTNARGHESADEATLMAGLRRDKVELALIAGLADLAGLWPLETVTAALSQFADAALAASLRFCLRSLAARGAITPTDPLKPDASSGLFVLAMGKYGAQELNYSSDIDLIFLYDATYCHAADPQALPVHFVRLTRQIVRILSERTAEGYVFRTDLRLRPDPGATPLALSVPAALSYYESLGQNWERAALIKARVAAGDGAAGAAFLNEIVPFIWRKYFDYAAIADVHAIKRQIHAHKGHGRIAVLGHNIKLGIPEVGRR